MATAASKPETRYAPRLVDITSSSEIATRMIKKLDELAPAIEAEAPENERIGRLGERSLNLLREAEIPLMQMSRRYGGYAMPFTDSIRVIERLSQIDASTGWIGGNWSSLGASLSFLPEDLVYQILAEDPMPYFGASGAPMGKALPVEGGYLVSGQWPFGSGDLHGAYVMASALICDATGNPLPGPGGKPRMATFVLSTANMQNKGNWDVFGLRGTGSIDFAFVDEFVPNDRVIPNVFGRPINPDRHLASGFRVLLSYLHTTFAMGAAQRLLDEVVKHASKPSRGSVVADSVLFRIEYGKQEIAIRSARALIFETWTAIDQRLEAGLALDRRNETLARASMLQMHSILRGVAAFALARGGGGALRAGTFQRWIRDALAGCQHVITNEDGYADIGWELNSAPENFVWGPLGLFPLPAI